MTTSIELPPAVQQLLGAARCSVRVDEGVLSIGESELEIRYALRPEGQAWRLDRLDRGDAPLLEIGAPAIDDVFRYLLVELGPVARAYRELRPTIFPTFAPQPAPGLIRRESDEEIALLQDGVVRARFRPEDPFGVSRSTDFTHYADLPLDRITELILTTTVGAAGDGA